MKTILTLVGAAIKTVVFASIALYLIPILGLYSNKWKSGELGEGRVIGLLWALFFSALF